MDKTLILMHYYMKSIIEGLVWLYVARGWLA